MSSEFYAKLYEGYNEYNQNNLKVIYNHNIVPNTAV